MIWRDRRSRGTRPKEAYFVRVDRTKNDPNRHRQRQPSRRHRHRIGKTRGVRHYSHSIPDRYANARAGEGQPFKAGAQQSILWVKPLA